MTEKKLPKVGILAIGTEITDGQINNTNASWISTHLKKHGIETLLHISAPDKEELILSQLQNLERFCSLIFITGGLGPTSDDLTRKTLSTWLQSPLKWDESSWVKIQNKLQKRGTQIRPEHRHQAHFPEGAQILSNSAGTADGFSCQKGDCSLWVFPGPPREIKAIWQDHLEDHFAELIPEKDKKITKIWRTTGAPESEISAIAEDYLSPLNVEIGYRASPPYVEVKAAYYAKEEDLLMESFDQLTLALKPYLT